MIAFSGMVLKTCEYDAGPVFQKLLEAYMSELSTDKAMFGVRPALCVSGEPCSSNPLLFLAFADRGLLELDRQDRSDTRFHNPNSSPFRIWRIYRLNRQVDRGGYIRIPFPCFTPPRTTERVRYASLRPRRSRPSRSRGHAGRLTRWTGDVTGKLLSSFHAPTS